MEQRRQAVLAAASSAAGVGTTAGTTRDLQPPRHPSLLLAAVRRDPHRPLPCLCRLLGRCRGRRDGLVDGRVVRGWAGLGGGRREGEGAGYQSQQGALADMASPPPPPPPPHTPHPPPHPTPHPHPHPPPTTTTTTTTPPHTTTTTHHHTTPPQRWWAPGRRGPAWSCSRLWRTTWALCPSLLVGGHVRLLITALSGLSLPSLLACRSQSAPRSPQTLIAFNRGSEGHHQMQ